MAQQHASGQVLAWTVTVVTLGLVWLSVVMSLPSQQELSAEEPRVSRPALSAAAKPRPEPTLDLSIPGLSAGPPASATVSPDQDQPGAAGVASAPFAQPDPHAAQVTRLRCEAEIEQLCPDSVQGVTRVKCLKQRAQHLAAPCQQQLRERFVKWKEERDRTIMACQADVKRWCFMVQPGDGQILQCLQEHAQEVSDRCYETLPKGTVYFKQ